MRLWLSLGSTLDSPTCVDWIPRGFESDGSVECPAFRRIRLIDDIEGMVEASQICWATN